MESEAVQPPLDTKTLYQVSLSGWTIGFGIFGLLILILGLQLYKVPPAAVNWASKVTQSISFDFLIAIIGFGFTLTILLKVSVEQRESNLTNIVSVILAVTDKDVDEEML